MQRKGRNGYSKALAGEYISEADSIYIVSPQVKEQMKWENGKPTKEVESYILWFVSPNTDPEPFKVKFLEPVKLPDLFTQVKLLNLEACEVGNRVYFRAQNVEAVK